jgi:hypothetical protein
VRITGTVDASTVSALIRAQAAAMITQVLIRSPRRHAELSWFLRAPFQISKRAAG